MLRQRELLEMQREFVLGGGLQLLYNTGFDTIVQDIKTQLLTREDLDEHKRKAFVLVLRYIQAGFTTNIEKAKGHIPEWVEKITS
jgi:hypothetical protein